MAELIRGRYEPLEVVGAGGQSTVLRALDHRRGRLVGLKIRPRGSPDDEGSLLSEASILLGLEPHPLLCRVLEDFVAGDTYFLVMDWVEGRNLAHLLAEAGGGGLPLPDVVHFLRQVAEALDHLHRHRPPVVHGDVKPANVIVTPDAKAVLVDFGISHRQPAGEASPPFALAGTAGYAAPEVASGQAPSPAADVFSLAATAFALLTGGPPRPGARPAWTGIEADRARLVEYALRRGLAVDPARRPATASALIDALQGQLRTPNNLPAQATPFVGRNAEVAEIEALLATTRLLTLTGAGGIGRRRLAVQVAGDRLEEHPDGVFVVDIAGVSDPGSVVSLVCAALGLGTPTFDAVVAHLERRNVLLVLAGCEAAAQAGAELVAGLLAASPHVHVIATSRQRLGVAGELVYEAPTLRAPDLFRLPALDRLGEFDAVRLFVERATEVLPGFAVRASDAPGLAQIIRRLDALPLALELAAARVTGGALVWLVLDIAERFPLLDGGRRSPAERESTLDAVVQWACEPLAPAERALFQCLSVFAGGFTAAAAAAVCVGFSEELLESLAQRNLVVTRGSRWSMHQALRRHGARGLTASGEAESVRAGHLEWALTVPVEQTEERANVLVAKAWAVSRPRR